MCMIPLSLCLFFLLNQEQRFGFLPLLPYPAVSGRPKQADTGCEQDGIGVMWQGQLGIASNDNLYKNSVRAEWRQPPVDQRMTTYVGLRKEKYSG